jgi:hypothetical protein
MNGVSSSLAKPRKIDNKSITIRPMSVISVPSKYRVVTLYLQLHPLLLNYE